MKKLIYILCCLFCLFITVDMGYDTWEQLSAKAFSFRLFMRILALLGWCVITYGVATRRYGWVQKLCK
ncbi:hypothetical protein [Bacteroides cellulosilyticus]|uniref:hypothetical protein n=1 Tax=Bacteroides cellulosilyticus TaxID=246787 RepID=UPI00189CB6CA|nr:hypothetical protein [Bacteroides cellulosilyticus]MBX9085907.1 hypothetical protein [Bacteroides cellulosilyticus]